MRAVILAAGMGKRMKKEVPKPLVKLLGKELVVRVYENVMKTQLVDGVTIVVNPIYGDLIKKLIPNADFAVQENPLGTAHALYTALSKIHTEEVLVLYSDTPLITSKTLKKLVEFHGSSKAAVTFLTGISENTYPYALVVRDENGNISDVEEHATPKSPPYEYSIGAYVIKVKDFSENYPRLKPRKNGEVYIPDFIKLMVKEGKNVKAFVIHDEDQFLGVNTPEDLKKAEEILKKTGG